MDELIFYPTKIKVDATNSFFAYDPYIETFWLKILGPTATLLTNYLVLRSMTSKNEYRMALSNLSFQLGTGLRSGKQSPVFKQLRRLCENELLYQISENEFLVPKSIKPLSQHQLRRFEGQLRVEHDDWIQKINISPLSTQKKRIRALLARLDLLGAQQQEFNNAISSCGLHPSIIGEVIATSMQIGD